MHLAWRTKSALLGLFALSVLSGCATWATSSVDSEGSAANIVTGPPTQPANVLVTETDYADRKYVSLGDITVTVNKTTIFHDNPTKEMVNQKLREEAAKLSADAVIFVRYGTVGVSALSWGSLEGKGRAIKFSQ